MASAHKEPRRRVVRCPSWPLVAAGFALLALGLLAYAYAVSYVPRQKTDDTGRINHIEPTLTTAAPAAPEGPTPTPRPTPRHRTEASPPSERSGPCRSWRPPTTRSPGVLCIG